mgnify:CR=1 FL=1
MIPNPQLSKKSELKFQTIEFRLVDIAGDPDAATLAVYADGFEVFHEWDRVLGKESAGRSTKEYLGYV